MDTCINEQALREIGRLQERAFGLFEQAFAEADAIKRLEEEIKVRKDRRISLWDEAVEIMRNVCTANRIFNGGTSTGMATQAGEKDK